MKWMQLNETTGEFYPIWFSGKTGDFYYSEQEFNMAEAEFDNKQYQSDSFIRINPVRNSKEQDIKPDRQRKEITDTARSGFRWLFVSAVCALLCWVLIPLVQSMMIESALSFALSGLLDIARILGYFAVPGGVAFGLHDIVTWLFEE